jgi:hypothetical protein
MMSGLPNLFGRDFAVGHFLPAAGFLFALAVLLRLSGSSGPLARLGTGDAIAEAGLALLLALLLGIALSTVNRELIRFLEGYGALNPFRPLRPRQRRRHRRLRYEAALARRERRRRERSGRPLPDALRRRLIETRHRLAVEFPHEEALVLPTALGNAIRAFEAYPFVVYGIDAIGGWTRLLAVIPEGFRGAVAESKARLDFWINLWLLALVLVLLFFLLPLARALGQPAPVLPLSALPGHWLSALWFPLAGLALAWLAYRRAVAAAIEWGHGIKAAFDVFLPDLVAKMGFDPDRVAEAPRAFWHAFNVRTTYRQARDLGAFRPGPPREAAHPTHWQCRRLHGPGRGPKSGTGRLAP